MRLIGFIFLLLLSSEIFSRDLSSNRDLKELELRYILEALALNPRNNEILYEPRHSEHSGHDDAINFTNEWIVHVPNGDEQANQVALETGYENLGLVRNFLYFCEKH